MYKCGNSSNIILVSSYDRYKYITSSLITYVKELLCLKHFELTDCLPPSTLENYSLHILKAGGYWYDSILRLVLQLFCFVLFFDRKTYFQLLYEQWTTIFVIYSVIYGTTRLLNSHRNYRLTFAWSVFGLKMN